MHRRHPVAPIARWSREEAGAPLAQSKWQRGKASAVKYSHSGFNYLYTVVPAVLASLVVQTELWERALVGFLTGTAAWFVVPYAWAAAVALTAAAPQRDEARALLAKEPERQGAAVRAAEAPLHARIVNLERELEEMTRPRAVADDLAAYDISLLAARDSYHRGFTRAFTGGQTPTAEDFAAGIEGTFQEIAAILAQHGIQNDGIFQHPVQVTDPLTAEQVEGYLGPARSELADIVARLRNTKWAPEPSTG